jgi:hypothetical protein
MVARVNRLAVSEVNPNIGKLIGRSLEFALLTPSYTGCRLLVEVSYMPRKRPTMLAWNKNKTKALVCFVLSLIYLFLYGTVIKSYLLNALSDFSKMTCNLIILLVIPSAYIFFIWPIHFYYKNKHGDQREQNR